MTRSVYQRYLREFLPAMGLYMAVMVLLWPQVSTVHQPLLRAALALTPMLPLAFAVRAMVRLVLRSDELEQRIHLVGLAVSTGLVGTVSLAVGFLAAAHVVSLDGTALLWVFPALAGTYGLARGWAGLRFGGAFLCDAEEGDLSRRWLWRFGLALVAVALIAHGHIADYATGFLAGTGIGLLVVGGGWALWHRWGRRKEPS